MKVEMHCHTYFSQDGFNTPKKIRQICDKQKIDYVFITDHDAIEGAFEFKRQLGDRIIIGQEMSTGQGDLIGLFLKERIDPGQGVKFTIDKIKQQGGLVYLPHPFDEFRKSCIKMDVAQAVKEKIDIIEVFNSRTLNPKYNTIALEFAKANGIVIAVGSDAHHWLEVGSSYMIMDDFSDPQSFLRSLNSATYITKRCPVILRAYLKGLKILTGKK